MPKCFFPPRMVAWWENFSSPSNVTPRIFTVGLDGSANPAILMFRGQFSSLVQVIKSVADDFPAESIRLWSSS